MFSYKRKSFSENQQHQVLLVGPTQGRMIPRTATYPIEFDLCRYKFSKNNRSHGLRETVTNRQTT